MKEFIEALTHTLRTPLAIIQSDLEYISNKAPALATARTLRAVEKITVTLSQIENVVSADTLEGVITVVAELYAGSVITRDARQVVIECLPVEDLEFSENTKITISELFYSIFRTESATIYLLEKQLRLLGLTYLIKCFSNKTLIHLKTEDKV